MKMFTYVKKMPFNARIKKDSYDFRMGKLLALKLPSLRFDAGAPDDDVNQIGFRERPPVNLLFTKNLERVFVTSPYTFVHLDNDLVRRRPLIASYCKFRSA